MLVKTVWRLLGRRQKAQLLALQLLSVLLALGTVTGIAAILPFLTALTSTAAGPMPPGHGRLLVFLQRQVGLPAGAAGAHGPIELGVAFIVLAALAGLINLGGTLLMSRFAFEAGNACSIELFAGYLGRDYEFHLRTHSAVLTARLLHETSRITAGVLQSGLMLAANQIGRASCRDRV